MHYVEGGILVDGKTCQGNGKTKTSVAVPTLPLGFVELPMNQSTIFRSNISLSSLYSGSKLLQIHQARLVVAASDAALVRAVAVIEVDSPNPILSHRMD